MEQLREQGIIALVEHDEARVHGVHPAGQVGHLDRMHVPSDTCARLEDRDLVHAMQKRRGHEPGHATSHYGDSHVVEIS